MGDMIMRKNKKTRPILKEKKGVTAVLTAILIVMLLGFAALAIDIGYGMVTKNELQNIADAAALAGARQLGTIYQGMTYEQQLAYVVGSGDETLIKNAAIDVASQNKAGGMNSIAIRAEDILIGTWSPWSETNTQPNAVRVIARRDSLVNGQIATFFAKIFGISGRDVTALATAAMKARAHRIPESLSFR
jgi:Flp pilus assembly protein TadG